MEFLIVLAILIPLAFIVKIFSKFLLDPMAQKSDSHREEHPLCVRADLREKESIAANRLLKSKEKKQADSFDFLDGSMTLDITKPGHLLDPISGDITSLNMND